MHVNELLLPIHSIKLANFLFQFFLKSGRIRFMLVKFEAAEDINNSIFAGKEQYLDYLQTSYIQL